MVGLVLVAVLAACSQSRPPVEPEVAQPAKDSAASLPAAEIPEPAPAAPSPAVPAPDAPSGSMVVYACDDGSGVTVTYDEYSALVKLPTGSTMLSRAEGASDAGIDAYLGEELSLYRNGNLVQLQVAGKTRMCNKS
jgi:hypothetical protein